MLAGLHRLSTSRYLSLFLETPTKRSRYQKGLFLGIHLTISLQPHHDKHFQVEQGNKDAAIIGLVLGLVALLMYLYIGINDKDGWLYKLVVYFLGKPDISKE